MYLQGFFTLKNKLLILFRFFLVFVLIIQKKAPTLHYRNQHNIKQDEKFNKKKD